MGFTWLSEVLVGQVDFIHNTATALVEHALGVAATAFHVVTELLFLAVDGHKEHEHADNEHQTRRDRYRPLFVPCQAHTNTPRVGRVRHTTSDLHIQ